MAADNSAAAARFVLHQVPPPYRTVAQIVDAACAGKSPSSIVLVSVLGTLVTLKAASALKHGEWCKRLVLYGLQWGRWVLRPFIDKEIDKAAATLSFPTSLSDIYFSSIPDDPLPVQDVLEVSQQQHDGLDRRMSETLLSGVVYRGTVNNHEDALLQIIQHHLWSNPLFADYFGATRKMEAETATMVLELFHGDASTMAASYTFGGSESILLAMLAYRNDARIRMGRDTTYEVICASTAHPAFDKAAEYFGIRLVKVPVDRISKKILVDEVEQHITPLTIAIVASAPSFPYGAIDNVARLSDVALRHSIGLHVDACLGGFIVPFLGDDVTGVVDFRLAGVTTISADLHKWGGAPKGASCVMFRTKSLRHAHTFAYADYPGGLYVTSGVAGSRPGYVIACAWASLLLNGKKGFSETARRVVDTTHYIADGIRRIPGLQLMVPNVETTVVPFTSDLFDIYVLMKRMGSRGFLLNPLQFPCGVHLGVTLEHTQPGVADRFLACLADEVAVLVMGSRVTGFDRKHAALIYGSTQGVPDRTIVVEVLRRYVDAYYHNGPFASSTAQE